MGKCYGGILTTVLDIFSLVFKTALVNLKYPERASRRLRRTPETAFWVSCLPAGTLRCTERSKLFIFRAAVMTQSTHPEHDSWWQTWFLRWAFLMVRQTTTWPRDRRKGPQWTGHPGLTGESKQGFHTSCWKGRPQTGGLWDLLLDARICRRRPTRSSPMGVLWENVNGRNRAETAL